MNYGQTLDYLYSQLPMFYRLGAAAYKADLNNTIAICNLLNNPQQYFKSVHIAGTNGKGSVSHFIASILQETGLKVGLYTSPHFKDFRERIKINGENIHEDFVCSFIEKYKNDFEKIKPSFFEMTVGMAFSYFTKNKIDIAVVETGLGGRLDSTNIIHPVLSVITNISMDHTNLLGDTVEKIAFEKAGIIKAITPVVIGQTQEKIKSVFINQAKEKNAPIYFADEFFEICNSSYVEEDERYLSTDILRKKNSEIQKFNSPLLGQYQHKNIVTVFKSIELLKEAGFRISKKNIMDGVRNVIKNTGIMGRWQIISKNPLTICDMGHNEDGIRQVVEQIKITPHDQLHFVFGIVADKDIETILNLLPKGAIYYFCKADIPRGLDQQILQKKAERFGLYGKTYSTVKDAFKQAQADAQENDLVFVGGSTFVVAEIL